MKSLETVLKKREELQEQLEYAKSSKSYFRIEEWSKMSDIEKKEYSRIMGNINKLTIQIDALTYVINYDSKLMGIVKSYGGGN